MTAATYSDLIQLGWRRSGCYLYKPDNGATCCPQLTILLDSASFSPSKHQRQTINKFNNFIIDGASDKEGQTGWGPIKEGLTSEGAEELKLSPSRRSKKGKGRAKPCDLNEMLHAPEAENDVDHTFRHEFSVSIPCR
jgi:arginine-tRNA-protein transferase